MWCGCGRTPHVLKEQLGGLEADVNVLDLSSCVFDLNRFLAGHDANEIALSGLGVQ
jgi:hypothetical protein